MISVGEVEKGYEGWVCLNWSALPAVELIQGDTVAWQTTVVGLGELRFSEHSPAPSADLRHQRMRPPEQAYTG